jgi:phenylacetate-CoA ligase
MNELFNPIFFGKIAKSYLCDVNRVRKSNEKEIQRYQDKCLRKMVSYAYTVPLYHKKYRIFGIHPKDIRGIKDITKLPIVTKKDFRDSTAQMLLPAGYNINNYTRVSTSGSSGRPISIFSDPFTIYKTFIGFIRIIKEHGIDWRKARMALIADLSPDSAEEVYFSRIALPNLKTFFSLDNMKAFHFGESAEKLLHDIETFNPEFIGGYPDTIKILAILKRQGKGRKLEPRCIATSGSILDNLTRETIQNAFNVKIFDVYGATECSPMIFQCRKNAYHIQSDFVHMEFIDAQLKDTICEDGGNIIVTRLFGKGTPIIRYTGISDFIDTSEKKCACGINTPLVERIAGRKVDSIVLPNGTVIPPFSLTSIPYKVMHMLNTNKILQFQIIQESRKEVNILIVIDQNLRHADPKIEKIIEELKNQFVQKLGKDINVNIREVDKITTMKAGVSMPSPVIISKVAL